MKVLGGKFDYELNRHELLSEDISTFSSDEFDVQVFGKVKYDSRELTPEEIFKLWKSCGNSFTERIEGVFIVSLFDKINGTLSIFHDRSSSPVALYYTENNGSLYYSTSLKCLLVQSNIKRVLNEDYVEDFLINGYIVGEQTLVKNVFKLKFFHALNAHGGKACQLEVKYIVDDISQLEAIKNWTSVLDESIRECVSGEEINSPLSSGYDSNYILYIENRDFDLPINCFSVGGKTGKSELPLVEENAKQFPKVSLRTALTDESSLEHFPEIVYRLEGAIFECGLFLQYALAKLVSDAGKNSLICGEVADQIMNLNYFDSERSAADYGEKNKYYEFAEYPMAYGHYVILKKNGILCNSFGIESRYPFLNKRLLPLTKALVHINKKDKRFHVATCEQLLNEVVLSNISKIGGSTDVHSLFTSKEEMNRFIKAVKASDLYKKHGDKASLGGNFYNIDKRKSFSDLARKAFYALKGKQIKKDYFFEEAGLRELLCYAYVIIFEKLFLTDDIVEDASRIKLYDLIPLV